MIIRGLTGLVNMGTQCYINSCTQILVNTPNLITILNNYDQNRLNNDSYSKLLIEFNNLRNLMWSKNCTIDHKKWIHTIQTISLEKKYNIFVGDDQNDLPEFLLFILNGFHKALERPYTMTISGTPQNQIDKDALLAYNTIISHFNNNYSEIIDVFYGIHISKIVSMDNTLLSKRAEPFLTLDLAIPDNIKNITINDCLDLYYKSELLTDDNKWHNDKTQKKETVNKQLQVWSFPKVLIITFKRFNFLKKNNKFIDFPINNLDLSKYVIGYNKESYVYDLYAVCNHSGRLEGGHYTSYIKNTSWHEFNDTLITTISASKIVSKKSYTLFYMKKNVQ